MNEDGTARRTGLLCKSKILYTRKLQSYAAYGRAGKQTEKFGIKHFRVLTVNRECASSRKTPKKAPRCRSGLFIFQLTSLPPGRRIRPSLPQMRFAFGKIGCTSHHHFVAALFSMTRTFSSSISTSLPATRARVSSGVTALPLMRPIASRWRELCGEPSSTI